MALTDFLPRRSPNNIIEAADAAPPEPPRLTEGRPAEAQRKGAGAAAQAEPAAIARSYYVEDAGAERRYWQDYQRKALAFTSTDARLSSSREDLRTVGDMVELAAARGWRSVEVKGSETFRREAWIEAQARGIEARGYKASDPDRQEAERRRVERGLPAPEAAAPARTDAPAARTVVANDVVAVAPAPTASPPPEFKLSVPVGSPRSAASSAPAPTSVEASSSSPMPADHRRVVRQAERNLSPDGKLILAALSEKIDRQLNRYNAETKAELKAFVASELTAKERAAGPVSLSADQRRQASAPEPTRAAPAPAPEPRRELEQPRLSRSR